MLKIWENIIIETHDRPNRPEILEVENEEEEDADEKWPYILWSAVEKAIKEMREKKVTGNDNVPVDISEMLGEDGLRIMTHLINHLHEAGQWHNDFTEVTMLVLTLKSLN